MGRRKTPALTAAARERRDRLILDLFLTGKSPQQISEHPEVKLTRQRVNGIINAELDSATKDQVLLNEKAMTIHVARMERLVQRAFEHVDAGELRAIEVARRLLDQQGKLFELADRQMPAGPMNDNEMSADGTVLEDTDGLDELSRYRAQREQQQPKAQAE